MLTPPYRRAYIINELCLKLCGRSHSSNWDSRFDLHNSPRRKQGIRFNHHINQRSIRRIPDTCTFPSSLNTPYALQDMISPA